MWKSDVSVLHIGVRFFCAGYHTLSSIQGVNVYLLPTADVRKFAVSKSNTSNILTWNLSDQNKFKKIEVQRSVDNKSFTTIGTLSVPLSQINERFSFADEQPLNDGNYRLLFFDINGKKEVSHVIHVKRTNSKKFDVYFTNPVTSALNLKIETEGKGKCNLLIRDLNGQVFLKTQLPCIAGVNSFTKDLSSLPSGKYILTLTQNDRVLTKLFYKIR
jgi:hypothetical protein